MNNNYEFLNDVSNNATMSDEGAVASYGPCLIVFS